LEVINIVFTFILSNKPKISDLDINPLHQHVANLTVLCKNNHNNNWGYGHVCGSLKKRHGYIRDFCKTI